MSKLDRLRNAPPAHRRPERSLTLCLAPDLIGDVQALIEERSALAQARRAEATGDEPARPRRSGQGASAREKEIDTLLAGHLEEIAEHEGEMRVRANWTDGKWRNWVNAHPARAEGEVGYDLDLRTTSGVCNGDDLVEQLAEFAHEWNSEPLQPGDWARIFEPTTAGGDKFAMVRLVVEMYEGRLDFPQWRSSLSATLSRLSASASAPSSASPSDDSTDGSPDSSTAATT